MVKRIHIVIVESSTIIRCGIVTLLNQSLSHKIDIAEISDLSSLSIGKIRNIPDVIVVNPSHVGIFSLSQLRANFGGERIKVVALQTTFSEQSVLQNYDEVISIYDNVELIKSKIDDLFSTKEDDSGKKELSAREKEIVVSVVKGMTNKQMADELSLSTHTIIAHRRNIANKLQIHSPSGLTIYAIVNKLVDLSDVKNSITKERKE